MAKIIKALRAKLAKSLDKGIIISGTPSPVKTVDEHGNKIVDPNLVGYEVYKDGQYQGRAKVPSTFNFNEVSGVLLKEDTFTPEGSDESFTFYRMIDTFTNVDDVESSAKLGELLTKWATV